MLPIIGDSWRPDANGFKYGEPCLGIDLGTSNSCVAVWSQSQHRSKTIKNRKRGRTTPSVVSFLEGSSSTGLIPAHVVGEEALERMTTFPSNTVNLVKRLLGKKFGDRSLQPLRSQFNFKIVPAPHNSSTQELNKGAELDREAEVAVEIPVEPPCILRPEEVMALILQDLKSSAEAKLEREVSQAVITVPAYYNAHERSLVASAAGLAGFRAVRMLAEPNAAAMSYGLFVAGSKNVVVCDFGGGTFDVCVLRLDEGKFDILSTAGDSALGGEDITLLMEEIAVKSYRKSRSKRLTEAELSSQIVRAKLRAAVEEAKKRLSDYDEASISISDILPTKSFSIPDITRQEVDIASESILQRCEGVIRQALLEAGKQASEIDEIVLVGGVSRMPCFQKRVREVFSNKELCVAVNCEEAVAQGAAIQGAILSGIDLDTLRDVLMMDVVPLPIGLESASGEFEEIIPKNAKIPAQVIREFETFEDEQEGLSVDVYEGLSRIARENKLISRFNYIIPRSRRGKAGEFKHPVMFRLDENGIIKVKAGIDLADEEESFTTVLLLTVVCIILVGAYVYCKLYFPSELGDAYTCPSGSKNCHSEL